MTARRLTTAVASAVPGLLALLLLSACSSESNEDRTQQVDVGAGQPCIWGESSWDECHWAE